MLFRMKDEKAHQLEAELDKLQADGPAAWAKLPEEELFTPAGFSEERAEATSYSNYSYWGSTFRAFFKNRVAVLLLVALIAVLVFGLAPHFSSPEAHAGVIATIDEKIDNVLTLTAGSAGASALISAIPGDAGSPIADKLMDLSTGFLIVLAALFLEKYLISIFSGVALGIVTFAIRYWGSYTEGVSFALLFMNLWVPYINDLTRQTPYGYVKPAKKEAAGK